ncbi:retrovirus-related pol polyprotein from transposon 17.6 [Plakobranchus ocellatus]|uniref:Retrovirus-related pol polyprotein from transposon 17.6 n=1 Tax=Plakobranchus ocellatus TaxID=259542 RepID=A0AAV4AY67_9GAST|nr:retrovirus-related pol polyprotein from transposon 17.6 [Plakobranchus ocellatus]
MSQSTFFTSCDLSKAYWQIFLSKECCHITAFQTPLGLMHWCRMPFGLVGAPAQFIRLMRIMLKDCPNLLNYFDDTLVHTPTWVQHPDSLRTLFAALRKHDLTVNPAKLSIGQTRIEFLGHVVSNGTLAPLPSKVQKVVDLRTPTTKKQVQSLMGLLNYYRLFFPSFSTITTPLTNLLRKGSPDMVRWSEECQQAFDAVSDILSSEPVLIIPDVNAPFVVQTDASDYGIGAVLLQMRSGKLMPRHFASRKLLPREQNYSTIERETLAIVYAVSAFYKFLAFRHFELQCDHRPISFLKKGKVRNSRLMRWALALQEFSFSITYIPGGKNVHADALSRLV